MMYISDWNTRFTKALNESMENKVPSALDYLDKAKLSACWKDVQKNVVDLNQRGSRFKEVTSSPFKTNSSFSAFYFVKYQNNIEKKYNLGDVCVIFKLKNVNGLTLKSHVNTLKILSTHPAYSDIVEANQDMLVLMGNLRDSDFTPDIFIGGPEVPMTTTNEIIVQIQYSGIQKYIEFVDDQLSNPNLRPKFYSPHRLYEPIKEFTKFRSETEGRRINLAPIVKLRTLIDENPSVRHRNREFKKEDFEVIANSVIRGLIENGFKYKHIIEDARRVNTLTLAQTIPGPQAFFLMAMSGNYKDVDVLNFKTEFFLYNENYPYFALSVGVLKPMFKYCLNNTDLFWELTEEEQMVLFLLYDKDLLETHMAHGTSPMKWVDVLLSRNNRLAATLIVNNKGADARWIVSNIKKLMDGKGTNTVGYIDGRRALEVFRADISTNLGLIKNRFSQSNIVDKGKFKEEPEYGSFRAIIIDISQYLGNWSSSPLYG